MLDKYAWCLMAAGLIMSSIAIPGNSHLFPASTEKSGDPMIVMAFLSSIAAGFILRLPQALQKSWAISISHLLLGACIPYIIAGMIMYSKLYMIAQIAFMVSVYIITPYALETDEISVRAMEKRMLK